MINKMIMIMIVSYISIIYYTYNIKNDNQIGINQKENIQKKK